MLRAVLAFAAIAAGGGCTTFDFPAPSAATDASMQASDASPSPDSGADAGPGASVSFLGMDDAIRLCAQIFRCSRLAEAIELSLALPINTPGSPLGFSACMDWMASPVDPSRPGLAVQQGILQSVARAASCSDAEGALPVLPVRTDAACAAGCAATSELTVCGSGGGAFVASCAPPYFGQSGDCVSSDAGTVNCVSLGSCTAGASCTDSSTLRECYAPAHASFTEYDCALSGRQCATATGAVAACVVPGKLAPPCAAKEARDSCDADSVLHCAGGLMAQTEIKCGAVGGSCTTSNPAGVARCVFPGARCTPLDTTSNQCTGDAISVCIAGVPQTVDCTTIYAHCQPADATRAAHCG
jgi:hypothetical protein